MEVKCITIMRQVGVLNVGQITRRSVTQRLAARAAVEVAMVAGAIPLRTLPRFADLLAAEADAEAFLWLERRA